MISLYLAQPTWLHRHRAATKLAGLALITLICMPFSSLWLWAALLAGTIGLYLSLGKAAIIQLRSYQPMLWVFLLLFLAQWWLASWQQGLLVVLRMSALILLANAVTITTKLDDITAVFLWLMSPLKRLGLPTQQIAFAMSLCIRFIPILIAILDALLAAWKVRGGGKHYWRVIAPLTIQSLLFSQHVAQAINARGGIPKN